MTICLPPSVIDDKGMGFVYVKQYAAGRNRMNRTRRLHLLVLPAQVPTMRPNCVPAVGISVRSYFNST